MLEVESSGAEFTAAGLRTAALDGDILNDEVDLGRSAGPIDAILPAGQIVTQQVEEYVAAVDRLPRAMPAGRVTAPLPVR